jgi:hypothetical protein
VFIRYIEGQSAAARIAQVGAFALTRALLIGALGALVALIGTIFLSLQKGAWPAHVAIGPDQAEAIAILEVGGTDGQRHWQTKGVGDQMTLAAVDLIAGIEPGRAAGLRGLDALAVDAPGRVRCRH